MGRRLRTSGRAQRLKRAGPQPGRIGIKPDNQLGRPRGDRLGDPVAEQQRYLTAFFSPAPDVNFGTRDAAIWILSPVAGLRPSRALRWEMLNFPNPEKLLLRLVFNTLHLV